MFILSEKGIKHFILIILLLTLLMMMGNLYFLKKVTYFNELINTVKDTAFYSYLLEGGVCNAVNAARKSNVRNILQILRIGSAFLLALLLSISFSIRNRKGYRTVEPLFCEVVKKMFLLSRVNFGKYKDGYLLLS